MGDKRREWELIKEQAPDVADLFTEINKVFGKPSAMKVELLSSGDVVESGEFSSQRLVFDDKARVRYGKR